MIGKKRRQSVKAFTLVEVMVAAAVMLMGIVGMIQVILSGAEMLDVSRKQTIAMQIIHGQMDNIRLSSYATVIALTTPATVSVDAGDQSSNISSGFVFGSSIPAISKDFRCTRTITAVKTDLKKVTYTVTWRGSTGRSYTRTGSTYVGNNGLYVTYQRS